MPERSELYQLLLKATSDIVYDYNLATNHIEWNSNLERLGYDPATVEPGVDWWASRLHPEDHATSIETLDDFLNGNSPHYAATYRFRCADGSYRTVQDRGFILRDDQGRPLRMIGTLQDVHLYYQLFEFNPQPMWVFNPENLRFLAVNQMAIQLYGYTREEFLAMSITDIRPPEDVPQVLAAVESPIREYQGQTIWRHYTKSRELLYTEVRTMELDYLGQPARITLITDVSRRIAVERELRESQKLDAIGQLAGGLAQDFNKLLANIQANTVQAITQLESIQITASRAATLTSQLLSFAGQQETQPQLLHWANSLTASEPLLHALLPPAVTMDFQTRTGEAQVHLTPIAAQQLLLNLITNARDAISKVGQIRITSAVVDMQPSHPDYASGFPAGPYLQLTIADSGSGMTESVMAHLYEPFFTTKPPGQGTGLGLPTVYGIVRQAGGWIRVDSEPGQGSEFRLYLPATV